MLYILSDQQIKELIWKDNKHGSSPNPNTTMPRDLEVPNQILLLLLILEFNYATMKNTVKRFIE